MTKDNFLKGTALLSITMLISKILGFVYVIPFTKMVGTEGFILFEYAYKPYVIMLSLSMMGIPMAVSKFTSKYNELGDYQAGIKLFKTGMIIMTITGLFWALLLFKSAPYIANLLIDKTQKTGNNIDDVVFVIKMISFALIIVPPMALMRGFFQGYQKMRPTAISQVVEQFVRIAIILSASFFIMVLGSGNVKLAVGISTFSAAIGAIVSIAVLIWYGFSYKNEFLELRKREAKVNKPIKLTKIYKEVLYYSIPFVVVGLAIPIYQNIDIFTINPTLIKQGFSQEKAEFVNSIVALVQKITTIPIVFANAFALTLVPSITKSFFGNNKEELHHKITKTLQLILFVTVPFGLLLYIFPVETYGVLLGTSHSSFGGEMTKAFSFIAFFFSLFVVTSSILQGINKQYFSILSLIVGLSMKIGLSVPLLSVFGGYGAAYGTMIGFGASIFINLLVIKKYAEFSFNKLLKDSFYLFFVALVTMLVLIIYKYFLIQMNFDTNLYIEYVIKIFSAGIVVLIVYLGLGYKIGLLETFFGNKFKKR